MPPKPIAYSADSSHVTRSFPASPSRCTSVSVGIFRPGWSVTSTAATRANTTSAPATTRKGRLSPCFAMRGVK